MKSYSTSFHFNLSTKIRVKKKKKSYNLWLTPLAARIVFKHTKPLPTAGTGAQEGQHFWSPQLHKHPGK